MQTTTKKIRIEFINYGLAYTVVDSLGNKHIQINKDLLQYPDLYNITIQHELHHMIIDKNYKHLLFDFKESFNLNNFKFLLFYIKHPKAFLSSSPILIENGKLIILPYNLITILICFISIILLIFLN